MAPLTRLFAEIRQRRQTWHFLKKRRSRLKYKQMQVKQRFGDCYLEFDLIYTLYETYYSK